MSDVRASESEMLASLHIDETLTVPVFLRSVAERFGDRTALLFEDERWSYDRLYREVRRMESALLEMGVTKGSRVGLIMGTRPQWAVAALATMSLGAVCVPLSTYEPAVKLHGLLRHADIGVLILQDRLLRHTYLDELVEAIPAFGRGTDPVVFDEGIPALRRLVYFGDVRPGLTPSATSWDSVMAGEPRHSDAFLDALEAQVHPMDDALVMYTSGTSGASKGVIHTHRSTALQLGRLWEQFTLEPDDVVWGTFPLFWSAGFTWCLGAALASGAQLVMQETFDAREALELIARHRVTVAHLTPPQATAMREQLQAHPVDISSLRIAPRGSFDGHLDLPDEPPFGGASLGLTETLTLAASIPWDSPIELRTTTHGRAMPGMSIRIVDPDTGKELGSGEFGEIALKGTAMMRGYHKMFPEQYFDDEGYYRTSDAGSIDADGFLHFTGRMSQVIRTNAANVSPAEVETALYKVQGVALAAVVGVPDSDAGELVVAAVVPASNAHLVEDEVRLALKDQLAGYKIPVRIFFLEQEELPLTPTGKPVLGSLRALVSARMGIADPA